MKYLVFLFLVIGCGKLDRAITSWTGDFTYKCSKHGVEYVQSDSGIAVSLNQNGETVRCQP